MSSIFTQIGSVIKNAIEIAMNDETTARTTAISDETTARTTAISTETSEREAADAVLESGLLDAVFTGTMSNVTYDAESNITGYTKNNLTVSNIVYNDDGNVSTMTETVTIDGVNTVKNFSVSYNVDGNVDGISEV